MYDFLTGALAMSLFACCLLFMRMGRRTGDAFFRRFALAFGLLAANRIGHVFITEEGEAYTALFLLRLLAFVVILYAVIRKNMSPA